MRRPWPLLVLLFVTGCTPWWQDRWTDLGDPFRVAVVDGWGAGATVGPSSVGAGLWSQRVGFGDGRWQERSETGSPPNRTAALLLFGSRQLGPESAEERARGKWQGGVISFVRPACSTSHGPFQKIDQCVPIEAFTEIRAAVALGIGLELGLNVGEIGDLLLGFVGLDPLGDDLRGTMDRRVSIQFIETNGRPAAGFRVVLDGHVYRSDNEGRVVSELLTGPVVEWGTIIGRPRWDLEDPLLAVQWIDTLEAGDHRAICVVPAGWQTSRDPFEPADWIHAEVGRAEEVADEAPWTINRFLAPLENHVRLTGWEDSLGEPGRAELESLWEQLWHPRFETGRWASLRFWVLERWVRQDPVLALPLLAQELERLRDSSVLSELLFSLKRWDWRDRWIQTGRQEKRQSLWRGVPGGRDRFGALLVDLCVELVDRGELYPPEVERLGDLFRAVTHRGYYSTDQWVQWAVSRRAGR